MQADFGGGMAATFDSGLSGSVNFTTNVQPNASFTMSAGGLVGSSVYTTAEVNAPPIVYPGPANGHVSVSADLPTGSVTMNSTYPGSVSASFGTPVVHASIPEGHVSVSANLPTASISTNSGHVSLASAVDVTLPMASLSFDVEASKAGVSFSVDAAKVDKKKKEKEKKGDESSSSSEDEGDEKKVKKSHKTQASAKVAVAVPAVNVSGGAAVTMATPTIVAGPTGGGVSFNAGITGPSIGVAMPSTHGGSVSLGCVGGVTVGIDASKVGVSVSADAAKVEKKKKEKKKEGAESSSSSSEDENDKKKAHKKSPKAHASVNAAVTVPAGHLSGGTPFTVAPVIAAGPTSGVSFHAGYAGPPVGVAMMSPDGRVVSIGGVGSVAVGSGGISVTTTYPAHHTSVKSSGSCTLL